MKPVTLVKLKMKKIYKACLTFIGMLIVLVSSVGILYLFYDKVIDPSNNIEVNGVLSINYVDGKSFNSENNKEIKFSISNSSEEVQYYNIVFLKVRGEGEYRILYNDAVVMNGDLKTVDEVVTDSISIDALETKVYTLELTNKDDKVLKGLLNVRLQKGKMETFADVILKNNSASENSLTKVGTDIAVENEGLIKSSDDIGVSYYFRGNIPNNYVKINDLLWRIVRINGDGTTRLVLNDTIKNTINYYNTSELKDNFNESSIYSYLNSWFEENLRNYTKYIANTRYCNDVSHDDAYTFLNYTRIVTNKIPTLNCLSNSITSKIGILSVDEVVLAGASTDKNNNSYYLYNANFTDSWFTMSGAKGNDTSLNLFMVDQNGKVRSDIVGSAYHTVRPVINLIKNAEVTGSGTLEDPYLLKEE